MFGAERLEDTFRSFDDDHVIFLDRLFAGNDEFQAVQSPFDDSTAVGSDLHTRFVEREQL